MTYWIFKAIWVPIVFVLTTCATLTLLYMLKEVSWNAPLRWLTIIACIAFIADWMVNR